MRFYQFSSLALVLLAGLATNCQPGRSQGRAVYFGPTAVYRLGKTDQEVTPDPAATTFYEQRFNFHPRFNQPLHRLVRGTGPETVYLGLVMPPVPARLAALTAPDSVWQLVSERAEPHGNGRLALLKNVRRGEYNVRYVGKAAKSGNTHVINLLTADSAVARSYYVAKPLFKGNLLL